VEVLRNVTTKQQQQQQPLEAGRQIIFQEGVASTNERARESERKRPFYYMYVMINKGINAVGDPNDPARHRVKYEHGQWMETFPYQPVALLPLR
jgi:hypothetical protein